MDRATELAIIRRAYAKQILAASGVEDPRLEAAFAAVRREDFLGPGAEASLSAFAMSASFRGTGQWCRSVPPMSSM